MRRPLARQILLPMAGILLVAIALAGGLNAWLASSQVRRRIETQLADVAATLSASNFPLESGVLRQTSGLTGAEFVLVDSTGKAAAGSDERLFLNVDRSPAAGGRLDAAHTVVSSERAFFHTTLSIDRRAIGGTQQTLHVFYPEQAWRDARWQATWPPLAIGGVASLLVAAAAYVVAARVTRPVNELRRQVGRIAEGDFQQMPVPNRNDEVRDLATAVNQMAERLAKYEEDARKSERLQTLGTLGGGIAHQIRNAATGCRIALDLHERDCPLVGAGDDEAPLAVAVRQLALIETYVKRFLTLGRPAANKGVNVDLGHVVQQAIALVGPSAQHAGAEVHCQLPSDSLWLSGDTESLGQMLVNLLVNAVQATAQARVLVGGGATEGEGQIVVRLEQASAGRCRILVGDPGPGPAPAIEARLFEPFATDKAGGTGLGLVVSRQIAEDHGGRIWWERRDERTWFVVELPLASCKSIENV